MKLHLSWRSRSRQHAEPRRARLFVRAVCGLCDEARAEIAPLIRQGVLDVVEVNVDRDEALERRYGLFVPVLVMEAGSELHWPFDREAVLRAVA